MAGVTFGNVKGGATFDKLNQYEFKMGDNVVRLFGKILPRYLYWIKGDNNKTIPFECLAFNRDTEEFDNSEVDHIKEYFPDLKCKWGYSMLCIDNGEVKIFNFKKKLFDQIRANVGDLGDPTDPEDGWNLFFSKQKTGPLPINVEYTLQPVKCLKSKGPLTEEEKKIIEESKSIDELLVRPTPEQQKELLEKIVNGGNDENIDEDTAEELSVE